jgi:hypothetical protein
MSGQPPSIARPETMVGQFYDAEAFNASSGWTPGVSRKQSFARGFIPMSGTTMTVTMFGVPGSTAAPSSGISMTGLIVGQVYQMAITAITAGTATGIVLY